MLSRDAQRNIIAVAALVIPVLLVKATAMFLGAEGPRRAAAFNEYSEAGAMLGVQPSPASRSEDHNPEIERLGAYLDTLHREGCGPSPMFFEPPHTAPPPPTEPGPERPQQEDVLRAAITAIMSSRTGNIALIDGRPHTVGDTTPDGRWIIREISINSRSVTFEHVETGESRVLEVIGQR